MLRDQCDQTAEVAVERLTEKLRARRTLARELLGQCGESRDIREEDGSRDALDLAAAVLPSGDDPMQDQAGDVTCRGFQELMDHDQRVGGFKLNECDLGTRNHSRSRS